jgi:hypothetical protein
MLRRWRVLWAGPAARLPTGGYLKFKVCAVTARVPREWQRVWPKRKRHATQQRLRFGVAYRAPQPRGLHVKQPSRRRRRWYAGGKRSRCFWLWHLSCLMEFFKAGSTPRRMHPGLLCAPSKPERPHGEFYSSARLACLAGPPLRTYDKYAYGAQSAQARPIIADERILSQCPQSNRAPYFDNCAKICCCQDGGMIKIWHDRARPTPRCPRPLE